VGSRLWAVGVLGDGVILKSEATKDPPYPE
jgi:hypothetical protein